MPKPMKVAVVNAVGTMPAAASDGKGYLVVSDRDGTVYGSRLGPLGNAIGKPFAICDPAHGSGSEAAAVWVKPRRAYYVVWRSGSGSIRGTFLGAGNPAPTEGTALDGVPPPPSMPRDNRTPAAACFGSTIVVVWMTERQDVRGVHVAESGKVLDPVPIQIPLGGPKQLPPGRPSVAAFDAGRFLVARDAIMTHRVIGTAFVKGAKVRAGPMAPGGPMSSAGQFNGAACRGTGHSKPQVLLVWTSGSTEVPGALAALRGARLDRSGNLLDPDGFDLHPTGGDIPAIAWNGKRYLVAWQKGSDIQAITVDPGGKVDPRGGTPLCSASSSRLAAAACGNGFLVVWDTGWAVVS